MDFETYHEAVHNTGYPSNLAMLYLVIKLNGEAGEVAEKVGKLLRGLPEIGPRVMGDEQMQIASGALERDDCAAVLKELGDVLWYVDQIAWKLGSSLEFVAEANIAKIRGRRERGTIFGDGDDR